MNWLNLINKIIKYFILSCCISIIFYSLSLNFNFYSPHLWAIAAEEKQINQENFGFKINDYKMEHYDDLISLNLIVKYRINTSPQTEINPDFYPDFLVIIDQIKDFLINYPNETDYWEIINRKLAQSILIKNPQISSLKIKIEIKPNLKDPYSYYTEVIKTLIE